MNHLEGCQKVKFGRADDFFLEQEKFRDSLDIWEGELYLELHRGTMTTQARTKKYNRLIENRLYSRQLNHEANHLSFQKLETP